MTLKEAVRVMETLQRHTEWRNSAIAHKAEEAKALIVKAIKTLQEAVDQLDELVEDLAHEIDLNPDEIYYGEE